MIPTELAGQLRRPLRVIAGEGMVRAVKAAVVTSRDGREQVRVGILSGERLSIDHWAVRERPELFMPCDREDVRTASVLRGHLQRARRAQERALETARVHKGRPPTQGLVRQATRPLRLP
jgi:hypothetical protein